MRSESAEAALGPTAGACRAVRTLAIPAGLELARGRLQGVCTTIVLRGRGVKRRIELAYGFGSQPNQLPEQLHHQSERRESNPHDLGPKPSGLPVAYTPLVPRVGIEPTPPVFQTSASTRLASEGTLVTPAGFEPALLD